MYDATTRFASLVFAGMLLSTCSSVVLPFDEEQYATFDNQGSAIINGKVQLAPTFFAGELVESEHSSTAYLNPATDDMIAHLYELQQKVAGEFPDQGGAHPRVYPRNFPHGSWGHSPNPDFEQKWRIRPVEERALDYQRSARIDALGRFRFLNLPEGEYIVRCMCDVVVESSWTASSSGFEKPRWRKGKVMLCARVVAKNHAPTQVILEYQYVSGKRSALPTP